MFWPELGTIAIVGAGGIGAEVARKLVRGLFTWPASHHRLNIIIIDGKPVSVHNLLRQGFPATAVHQPKAYVLADELRTIRSQCQCKPVLHQSQPDLPEFHLDIDGQADFLGPHSFLGPYNDWLAKRKTTYFVCVDSHADRLAISKLLQGLPTCRAFFGGNGAFAGSGSGEEWGQGTVLNYIRRDGKDCFPPIEQYHPEIAHPTDRRTAVLACDEVSQPGPIQSFLINHLVALEMLTAFQAEMNGVLTWDESFIDLAGSEVVMRRENRWQKKPLNPHFPFKKKSGTTSSPTTASKEKAT